MTSFSLNPDNIPRVRLDFMNHTHREEVEIVASIAPMLEDRRAGKQNDSEISKKLASWFDHTLLHFTRENELMQKVAFPAFPVHSREHEITLHRMNKVITAWDKNRDLDQLQDYIFNVWPRWFINHVTTMDTVTAEFAHSQGYDTE